MDFTIPAIRIAFILQAERLGRRRIAERTGLSEMSVRLELEQLRDLGFVRLDRSGCQLTVRGRRSFSRVLDRVIQVQHLMLDGLRIDEVNLAAHLRAQWHVPEAWKLRDEAVREGSSGLILLVHANGEWAFAHNVEPVRIHAPGDAAQLDEAFTAVDSDHLCLIVSGPEEQACARGLWRAVRALSKIPD